MVTLRIDGEFPVYADASAVIEDESALGRKYLNLDPGTPAAGLLGDRAIGADRTTDSVALDDLFNIFDEPTRDGLSTGLVELGGGAIGHGKDLRDLISSSPELLPDLGTVSAAVSSPDAQLPELLRSVNTLAGRFDGRQQQLSALLGEADATFRALTVDEAAPLAETLHAVAPALRAARPALDGLEQPLDHVRSTLATMRSGAQALGESADDLRGALRAGVEPLSQVPGVSDEAKPAVDDLTATFADLRPVVDPLDKALDKGDDLLDGLSPYATDVGRFFHQLENPDGLLSGSFAPGQHYFQVITAFPLTPIHGSGPDPFVKTDPYPEPGGGAFENPLPEEDE